MADMKAGYKQTDIGVIPEDWDIKQLGNLGGLAKGSGIKKDEAQSGTLPCVRYGELYTKHHDVIRRFHSFISEEVSKNSKKLKYGDILFACSGETKEEIGKCASFLDKGLAYAGGDIIILSPHSDNAEFLGYLLNSDKISRQKSSLGQGDAVVHINAKSLASIPIPLPKPEEQKQIAAALSDVDGLIESLEQLIAKKRDMKTAAMQQLLTGKKRLLGFDGEWKKRTLGELATIRNRKVNTLNNPIAHYCIELENIVSERGTILSSSDATDRNSTKYIFEKSDILFGRLRPYLKKFWRAECDGVCSTEIWPLIPASNDLVARFLAQLIRTDEFVAKACESYGTHMPRADWKVLEGMEIYLPKPEEQTAIAAVLSDMDSEIDALVQRLAKARSLKAGMMQELLTGKTRLIKTNKKQEAA